MSMNHQDWNTITFANSTNKAKQHQKNKVLSQKSTNENVKMEAPGNLGKLISQARCNKTRQELANDLGVAVTLLTRWETGKDIPTNSDIAKIEKILRVKLPRIKKVKQEI
jgi:ribosome-binding protein aMBF1 (putative translation factor)